MLRSENETLYDPQVRDTYFIEMIITYIDTQPSLVVVSDVLKNWNKFSAKRSYCASSVSISSNHLTEK